MMADGDCIKTDILADGFLFLEAPRWRGGRLWMSDVLAGRVLILDPDGWAETVGEVLARPSGLGFLPDGTPLVVSMQDRRLLRLERGGTRCHAALGPLVAGPINDMAVDARGRAYVGSCGFDVFEGEAFRPGGIVLVQPTGAAEIVAEGLDYPNGIAPQPGGGTLIVAETYGRRLTAFDIEAGGRLSNRRLFADLGEDRPDGICLDRDGAVWTASFNRGRFLRVLEGGRITHRVDLGDRHAVACQLGGRDGRTLYCLTLEGSWADICAGRARARVEVAAVDVPGAGSP